MTMLARRMSSLFERDLKALLVDGGAVGVRGPACEPDKSCKQNLPNSA